jgi:hypothetical protein
MTSKRPISPTAPLMSGSGSTDGYNLIYADCSWSMLQSWRKLQETGQGNQQDSDAVSSMIGAQSESIFEIQRRSIKELISSSSGPCIISGYAGNVVVVQNADELVCCDPHLSDGGTPTGMIHGTSFVSVFRAASSKRPIGDVHIHLFSDGCPSPQLETEMSIMAARDGVSGDISTYYVGDPRDATAIGLMKRLARGRGAAHAVFNEPDLIKAVRAGARSFRDRLPDIKNSLAHARTRAELGGQIANITGIVDNVAHDLNDLAQNHNTTRSELDMLSQADGSTLEALQVLRQQRDANTQGRAGDVAQHTAMLTHAGACFGQLASDFLGGQLLAVAQNTATAPGIAGRPAFQQRTLEAGLMTRAAALLSAPSAGGIGALPSSQQDSFSPASAQALPPPSKHASEVQGGASVPVVRRRRSYGQ